MTPCSISNNWSMAAPQRYFHNVHLINELMNDKAVYITAPATPGMLIRNRGLYMLWIFFTICEGGGAERIKSQNKII